MTYLRNLPQKLKKKNGFTAIKISSDKTVKNKAVGDINL